MPLGMLGKYERLDVLGHGASGIVYLAKDTLLNKQVALKEVDVQAGDLPRFLEEARVMDRLRHPNIVRVNGVDRIEGKVIIDMEYVRGQNLQEMLRTEGTLPIDRALDIAAQTLDALDYAHRMQTVHRDIKPANILIGRDGSVKLVDFGLAEILATNAYAGGAGTYAYMAPEDFAEEDRSDSQSDIWAVGVTLYEMMTGQRPFTVARVKDPFSWKRALEREFPAPLSKYLPAPPIALQAILDRALAREKRSRYQTAGAFRDDIGRFRAGEETASETLRASLAMEARRHSDPENNRSSASNRNGLIPFDYAEPTGSNGLDLEREASDARSPRHSTLDPERSVSGVRQPGPPASVSAPGLLVADVHNPPNETDEKPGERHGKFARRMRLPSLSSRKNSSRLAVDPDRIDFGSVRKGEKVSAKIQARIIGIEGPITAQAQCSAAWLTIYPPAFDRARQTLTVTAHTDRAWETGEFHDNIHFETDAGAADIPVRLMVLKPRPRFSQIAVWYLPLFAAAMFPAAALALGSSGAIATASLPSYIPSAVVASALLGIMLLFVAVAADIGVAERIACGILTGAMCCILGLYLSMPGHNSTHIARGYEHAFVTAAILGGTLALQVLHLRKWKLWAGVVAFLGIGIGSLFLRLLT